MGWKQQGKRQLAVRMHPRLYQWIHAKADEDGLSMNEVACRAMWEAMVRDEMARTAEQLHPRYTLPEIQQRIRGEHDG